MAPVLHISHSISAYHPWHAGDYDQLGNTCCGTQLSFSHHGQLLLTSLWIIDALLWNRDANGNISPIGTTTPPKWWKLTPWYALGILGCCALSLALVWHWRHRHTTDFQIYIGGSSEEKVVNAMKYWLPCGLSATALLIFVALIGWWYQRRL
ncbi:hypothetical protein K505DRAFT_335616 [Melanomma pulvis-pyrius CBS 109.77]|uniref:Uncharacterized protein n=1 Tax=Melanomma pulvis-pyrius CBS 109.77 TaxID=1314802 RepID=A0A6A6XHN7_9PLEO|nr:hypothetical protein K505DRAFT_335616 [Melanomma pulvis-pyrius CBS 109.77]